MWQYLYRKNRFIQGISIKTLHHEASPGARRSAAERHHLGRLPAQSSAAPAPQSSGANLRSDALESSAWARYRPGRYRFPRGFLRSHRNMDLRAVISLCSRQCPRAPAPCLLSRQVFYHCPLVTCMCCLAKCQSGLTLSSRLGRTGASGSVTHSSPRITDLLIVSSHRQSPRVKYRRP
jgi:hypothetical protein